MFKPITDDNIGYEYDDAYYEILYYLRHPFSCLVVWYVIVSDVCYVYMYMWPQFAILIYVLGRGTSCGCILSKLWNMVKPTGQFGLFLNKSETTCKIVRLLSLY